MTLFCWITVLAQDGIISSEIPTFAVAVWTMLANGTDEIKPEKIFENIWHFFLFFILMSIF
jgi:hypothetical protein